MLEEGEEVDVATRSAVGLDNALVAPAPATAPPRAVHPAPRRARTPLPRSSIASDRARLIPALGREHGPPCLLSRQRRSRTPERAAGLSRVPLHLSTTLRRAWTSRRPMPPPIARASARRSCRPRRKCLRSAAGPPLLTRSRRALAHPPQTACALLLGTVLASLPRPRLRLHSMRARMLRLATTPTSTPTARWTVYFGLLIRWLTSPSILTTRRLLAKA